MGNSFKLSKAGEDFIAKHEGEVLRVYKDAVGYPTMGIGHLLTPRENKLYPVGTKITKEFSRELFRMDVGRFERAASDLITVPLNQNQIDAVLSLMFNIGEGAFKRSTVLKNINKRQFVEAGDSFLKWVKAGGKVLTGLVRRRKDERRLFLTPLPAADPSPEKEERPVPVPGDVPTAPLPDPTSPSVPTDKGPQRESIGTVVVKTADTASLWLDKANEVNIGVGRLPFLGQFITKGISVLGFVAAFAISNWELALVAFVLFVIAAWYWTVVRRRAVTVALVTTEK